MLKKAFIFGTLEMRAVGNILSHPLILKIVSSLGVTNQYVQPRTIAWDKDPEYYKEEAYMENLPKIYVGVDVSKKTLDVYYHPTGKKSCVENTQNGVKHLAKELSQSNVEVVVFEASGGYETLLKKALEAQGVKFWWVNPQRVSHFRLAEGIQAKSDTLDARVLALFGEQHQSQYEPYKYSPEEEKLRDFVIRRCELIKMLIAEKARLKSPSAKNYAKSIKKILAAFEKEIERIEQDIAALTKQVAKFEFKAKILQSIPGLGNITAFSILSTVPELGSIQNKAACALFGVVPYTRRSGTYKGKEFIKGGRPVPRRALYMAILMTVRCNPVLRVFYQRLIAAGKKPKVALIAAMRKLVIIINTLLRKEEMWNPAF